MLRDDEVDDVIEALENHFSERLSPWEAEFLESVSERWEQQRRLSDAQRAKLDQIFERFARSG